MGNSKKQVKKIYGMIITIVILSICLCITTFALIYSALSVEYNIFQTGTVRINLNDGKPVIEEHEYTFEPGMTIEKNFFIENQSTYDVYYRLYFDNIEGSLADVLNVQIRNNDTVLFSGKVSQLTKAKTNAADDILKQNKRRNLTISFHYPEISGNESKNAYLTFDLIADAVQTKNNPDRLFS